MQRAPWLLSLALVALPVTAGCDLVTARESERAVWTKSYTLADGGRVEIDNVNGRIQVEAWDGNTVEVRAERIGKGATPEAAKRMLDRIEIREEVTPRQVRLETRVARTTGWLGSGTEVRYAVKVPAAAEVDVQTVNGGIEVSGVRGPVVAETTNGGVTARRIAGPIDASTTNGGVDVDVDQVAERGIELGCTNGGINLRLPRDSKATLSARITNGGIAADGLDLELTGETSRRRLEGRLNGGGPRIVLAGTNGGIRISPK
jgi:Putative adhesin